MKPFILFRHKALLLFLMAFLLLTFTSKAQPANDNHGGFALFATAPALTVNGGGTCTSTTAGTLRDATISASIPAFTCATSAFLFDVWYKFTATSSNHTIRLDNYGSTYTRRQFAVYQFNNMGTLSVVTCSALSTTPSTTALSVNFIDFSPGTTYLVRVMYPNTVNTPTTSSNSTFRLCVTTGTNNAVQPVLSGKSYTNITRPNGGTVQTGDVLEFRQSINAGNWAIGTGSIYNVTYHDTIPTGLSYVANSIKFTTNEGLQFESGITGLVNLTDASGDDEAVYSGGVLRVNVGSLPREGASALVDRQLVYQGSPAVTPITYASAGGGKIHSRGRPSQFARFVVIVVRYQVTVTAATGTVFSTSNGQFRYKTTTSSFNDIAFPQTTINFPRYSIYVSANNTSSLCPGGSGVNVYTGGDFGSGTTRHDSTQLTIAPGYSWIPFATGAPQDGEFAVVNNTSANGSINKYTPLPDATTRVHRVWDIIGDHTGAANPDSGNLAVPWGTNGGYMGVVNAAFGINTAIQKNITGLCPETYYEFSAWFKNVCAGCSSDSAGRGMGDAPLFKQYLATKTINDSAGVSPDLTYTIDGVDYYTTGPIIYDKKWIKKGFLFRSSSSGSITLTIRNNAPGGGGNDWAIDDIELTTCFPNMTYSPSANPNVCENDMLVITDTVRSVFDNYVEYKWQRWSAATSGPWVDIGGSSGSASPVWNATLNVYEYVSTYTVPGTETGPANDGDLYRLVVASTTANLAGSSCSYSDPTTISLNVLIGCGPPLKADLLSATGRLTDNISRISWVTTKEDEPVSFSIERSDDGNNFRSIALINGYNNITAETNTYNYTDPVPVTNKVYYRVVMINNQNTKKYSSVIQLTPAAKKSFYFGTVVNPFNDELRYEIVSPVKDFAKIELIDGNGKVVKSEIQQVYSGSNSLSMYNTGTLSGGIYVLKASINGTLIFKKVMKEKK
jgi:trimeric autotransporter adhesin